MSMKIQALGNVEFLNVVTIHREVPAFWWNVVPSSSESSSTTKRLRSFKTSLYLFTNRQTFLRLTYEILKFQVIVYDTV